MSHCKNENSFIEISYKSIVIMKPVIMTIVIVAIVVPTLVITIKKLMGKLGHG